jgi:MFS family permease
MSSTFMQDQSEKRRLDDCTAPQAPAMIAQPPAGTAFARLDRRVYALAVARGINTMGFSIVLPFLAVYLHSGRGIAAWRIGAVYTISGIVGALTQAVAGELADRHGRRRLMIAALCVRAFILALMGFAIEHDAAFAWLSVLVVANAVVRSMFEPAAFAAVTDLTPLQDRVAAFGVQRIGINVGWAAGPGLGAYLAAGGYGRLFYLAVPATLVAAFLCAGVRDVAAPMHRGELAWRQVVSALGDRRFATFLAVTLLGMVLAAQLYSPLAMYATSRLGLRELDLGHLYTLNGVLVALLQFPAVRLIERIGSRGAILVGPLLYAAAYSSIGLAHTTGGLAICVAAVTVAEVILLPAQQALASQLGDPARQGRTMGLYGLTFAAGQSFGPIVGGLAIDHLLGRPLLMWGTLGALGVVASCGYALVLPRERRLTRSP